MPKPPRTAADILADLQGLGRENDRLEHHIAVARQQLKTAEAHAVQRPLDPLKIERHLARAAAPIRRTG